MAGRGTPVTTFRLSDQVLRELQQVTRLLGLRSRAETLRHLIHDAWIREKSYRAVRSKQAGAH